MKAPNYTREGNELFFSSDPENVTPHKVAVIDKNGELRMSKGQAEHREAVEAFLAESGDKIEKPQRVISPARMHSCDPSDPEYQKAFAEAVESANEIMADPPRPLRTGPPCPEEDPSSGDKTPAVIRWWFTYHPEEAAKKYAGRKFDMPSLD